MLNSSGNDVFAQILVTETVTDNSSVVTFSPARSEERCWGLVPSKDAKSWRASRNNFPAWRP